jgi:crotonobetainyl-CoA:carnitine CoA-transferase CaiB-like acyl-CoA transferase
MSGILEGIRVISMGQVVAVPSASSVMADWGAEVIKLEPVYGEMHRGTVRVHGADTTKVNWIIQVLNRNSKGLAVDLKQDQGREIIHKLIQNVDIFMCNYEAKSVKKLGLDYETLSAINPRLIYGFVSGYGTTGPDKDERGYDFTAGWARSGMMYLIGEPGTPPPPQRAGMIDSMAGAYIVAGICAALRQRDKTGRGQKIEISLYHAAVWTLCMDVQLAVAGGNPVKHDRTKPTNPIWNSYRTSDNRWFWMAMLQSDLCWPDFCRAIDRPELEKDPRFDSADNRTKNSPELVRIIDKVLSSRTMAEWEKVFRANNVIYGRVQTPVEVTTDPQALANNFFGEVEYSNAGKIKLVTSPVIFSENPASLRTPAPEIGQHTEEILLELGYNWEDIGALKDKNVIR